MHLYEGAWIDQHTSFEREEENRDCSLSVVADNVFAYDSTEYRLHGAIEFKSIHTGADCGPSLKSWKSVTTYYTFGATEPVAGWQSEQNAE